MANNNNILAGVAAGGAGLSLAWFAPEGTAAPTSATVALAAAWKDAGLCTENGLSIKVSESSKDIQAFGSGAPVRTLVTNSKLTFDLAFLESNPISLAVYNRLALDTIKPDATGAFDFGVGDHRSQKYAATFDVVDGANHLRFYCPSVEVTDRQDLAVQAGSEISYGVTLTAYPGSDGVAVHEFYVVNALKTGA